jgi:hypothetical protein
VAAEIWLAEEATAFEAAAPGLLDASLATRGLCRRCLPNKVMLASYAERWPKRVGVPIAPSGQRV